MSVTRFSSCSFYSMFWQLGIRFDVSESQNLLERSCLPKHNQVLSQCRWGPWNTLLSKASTSSGSHHQVRSVVTETLMLCPFVGILLNIFNLLRKPRINVSISFIFRYVRSNFNIWRWRFVSKLDRFNYTKRESTIRSPRQLSTTFGIYLLSNDTGPGASAA